MEIKVTDLAKDKLKEMLEEKKSDKSLRVFVAGYGWGGPSIGLALEEPKEDDLQVEVDDLNFAVEDGITSMYRLLTVDYSDSWMKRGFSVIPGSV